jgi:hypothetical protein
MLPTCTLPEDSNGMAASKRPQREPTSVISFTIAGAVSIDTRPCTVDFMITVPRGTHMEIAALRPSDDPVASTTNGQTASGNFLGTSSVVTPARSTSRILFLCLPKRCTLAPLA